MTKGHEQRDGHTDDEGEEDEVEDGDDHDEADDSHLGWARCWLSRAAWRV